MSIDSTLPKPVTVACADPVLRLKSTGFPPATHPSEASMYCRQKAMVGHHQRRLEEAQVVVVGAGGLGSWISVALARMGITDLTIIDDDRFDRTNAPRQLMFPCDIGEWKAHALARNIVPHMTNPGTVNAIAVPFTGTVMPNYNINSNNTPERIMLLVVGVDNNRCRLEAAAWGRANLVPVVFSMLSVDGLRAQAFLQRPGAACLSCVLPGLDDDVVAPCAAASIASCLMAAAHAIQLCVAAVTQNRAIPTWRETSLDGSTERTGSPESRSECPACGSRSRLSNDLPAS